MEKKLTSRNPMGVVFPGLQLRVLVEQKQGAYRCTRESLSFPGDHSVSKIQCWSIQRCGRPYEGIGVGLGGLRTGISSRGLGEETVG